MADNNQPNQGNNTGDQGNKPAQSGQATSQASGQGSQPGQSMSGQTENKNADGADRKQDEPGYHSGSRSEF
jgi:hypothetical protein